MNIEAGGEVEVIRLINGEPVDRFFLNELLSLTLRSVNNSQEMFLLLANNQMKSWPVTKETMKFYDLTNSHLLLNQAGLVDASR